MIVTAEFGGIMSAQLIDVSNFQGPFNWAGAKSSTPQLAGGICKATEGNTFLDPDLAHNWAGIKDQNLARGAYHFGHPGESPGTQLTFFLNHLAALGLTTRDILALDLEVSDGLTPAQVSRWAQTFMSGLRASRPHNPIVVYTMVSFATGGEAAGLGAYPLWLAKPASVAPAAPPPWARWTFWQWGTRSGVDADAFNGTAEQLAAWIDSFQPQAQTGTGPFRHYTQAGDTLEKLAASRNTSPWHLLEEAAAHYTDGDHARLAQAELPAGVPWYTSNP